MGISKGGMNVEVDGEMEEVSGYLRMFEASCNCIHIKKLDEIQCKTKVADDEFKVMLTLFALRSVLFPASGVHISSRFLLSLKDVKKGTMTCHI